MIRQGPLPRAVHGLIEYVAGALFIAAPFLFGFESGTATAVAIVAGIVIIVVAAITAGPTSLINSVPLAVHIVLDYVLAGVLVAAPFIFGFSAEGAPTAFFIVLGVVHLLVTIATRFRPRGEWVRGLAFVLPEDDPIARQRTLARGHPLRALNALAVRAVGTDLVTVRVDLGRRS